MAFKVLTYEGRRTAIVKCERRIANIDAGLQYAVDAGVLTGMPNRKYITANVPAGMRTHESAMRKIDKRNYLALLADSFRAMNREPQSGDMRHACDYKGHARKRQRKGVYTTPFVKLS
ncbi:MAG: hypothetical protein WC613_03225 [Candidatus Aenigmatarchaeota archaeon]